MIEHPIGLLKNQHLIGTCILAHEKQAVNGQPAFSMGALIIRYLPAQFSLRSKSSTDLIFAPSSSGLACPSI